MSLSISPAGAETAEELRCKSLHRVCISRFYEAIHQTHRIYYQKLYHCIFKNMLWNTGSVIILSKMRQFFETDFSCQHQIYDYKLSNYAEILNLPLMSFDDHGFVVYPPKIPPSVDSISTRVGEMPSQLL